MNKAFLFDLDGVLVNTEPQWLAAKARILPAVFGETIAAQLGSTMGVSVDGIYRLGVKAGATVSRRVFVDMFDKAALGMYDTAPLTEGMDELARTLVAEGYSLGIVSASPLSWVRKVVDRLDFKGDISCIVALHEHPQLRQKPYPDGYQEAMRQLGVSPQTTSILEDSSTGIAAAKASGAYTIALRTHLTSGYVQQGADAYAETPADVITILQHRQLPLG